MLSVQELFDQYANPLYGSQYGAGMAVSEFQSKKKTSSGASDVELVFSAAAISSLAQAGIDVSALGSYGLSVYGSDGSISSLQTDMSALFQALA